MSIIIHIFFVISMSIVLFRTINSSIHHFKRLRNIRKFDKFTKKCIGYLSEIDEVAKLELADYCLVFLTDKILDENIGNISIVDTEKEFFKKFGKHIPSYVVENRDKNIDNILK